jgi:hypothetical protein
MFKSIRQNEFNHAMAKFSNQSYVEKTSFVPMKAPGLFRIEENPYRDLKEEQKDRIDNRLKEILDFYSSTPKHED